MSLLLFNMMLALSIIDHDVYDPYDLDDYLNIRSKPKEKKTMKLNPCGECGGRPEPMTDKFQYKKLLSQRLFWWRCKGCKLVSEAVPRKKRSDRKWNQLSMFVRTLKEKAWTA